MKTYPGWDAKSIIDKLKPCPFCGGKAILKAPSTFSTARWVQCNKCWAHTASTTTIPAAARKWNKRRPS